MAYYDALEQLQLLNGEQLNILEQAHWRYLSFMGLCSLDDKHDQQAIVDRQNYPQWYTQTDTGEPLVTEEGIGGFMSTVSGLTPEVCLAWDEVDFCQTHGIDWKERIERGETL